MAEIKMVVIDLDDTLLDKEGRITRDNLLAVQRAGKRGIRVTLATGRMYRSALPYARNLGIDLPIITYQGALIKDPATGQTLVHRPVPLAIAKEIAGEMERIGYHLNAYLDDELLVQQLTPEAEYYRDLVGVPLKITGSLATNLAGDPTKLLVINEAKKIIPLMEKWTGEFGDKLYLTRSKPDFLEIMAKGADKGAGVQLLAERLGIKKEEIMVIGDSYNDREMFKVAGTSVAMGNAPREIQELAYFVTATNEESGVARALERFCNF